ncbi:hypothetical protein KIKIMORA_04800 [Brevundimonas phage vB_BpoS-Kikimora]|uniref:Uncharacterized protein n=1 Tax=Brevundimonas phage vB_BpoS-Kikimora TaxID=2948601 RepID=A0A9E7MSF8_9CAUD|nr:hypothetical protein KIKIMORA_04800 [Brevundimonas phage vB_BpoS-Kikimora]
MTTARSSVRINYLVTAYAHLTACKTIAVEAETPQEARDKALASIAHETHLSDGGWTVMPEFTDYLQAGVSTFDVEQADGRTLMRPTMLADDALLEALVWMVNESALNHDARLDDLTPQEAQGEIAAFDRVVAWLRGNGVLDVDLKYLLDNLADEARRAAIQLRRNEEIEAEYDDAERAMAAYDLSSEDWDRMPLKAQQALIEASKA